MPHHQLHTLASAYLQVHGTLLPFHAALFSAARGDLVTLLGVCVCVCVAAYPGAVLALWSSLQPASLSGRKPPSPHLLECCRHAGGCAVPLQCTCQGPSGNPQLDNDARAACCMHADMCVHAHAVQ
jgi:hypothetical protein